MGKDDVTDEFVTGLLLQQAQDYSLKFSAMGMGSFCKDKKPKHLPKPNTRFLRNIIKVTDNHNKALLAKEAEESQARLKDLNRAANQHSSQGASSSAGVEREVKSQSTIENKRQRRSGEPEDDRYRHLHKTERVRTHGNEPRPRTITDRHRSNSNKEDRGRDSRRCGPSKSYNTDNGAALEERRRGSHKRRDSRERTSRRDRHGQHSRHYRSRSPTHRSDSKRRKQRSQSERSRSPLRPSKGDRADKSIVKSRDSGASSGDESIGPAPPQVIRGRGDTGESSGIDRRFSESYDPKVDMEWNSKTTALADWDATVAAYRSRKSRHVQVDQD